MSRKNSASRRVTAATSNAVIKNLERWKKSFEVIRKGGVITVSIPNWKQKKIFRTSSFMAGGYLCGMLRRQLADRIARRKYRKPTFDKDLKVPTRIYSPDNISRHLTSDIVCIDISACYWRTALLLNIISKEFYERGLEQEEFKTARNAAIGSLGKSIVHEKHKGGMIVKRKAERDKYYNVRLHVLNHVYLTARKTIDACGTGFYFFLTDAFYVNKSQEKKVKQILKAAGYEFTSVPVTRMGLYAQSRTIDKLIWKIKGEKENKHIFISTSSAA